MSGNKTKKNVNRSVPTDELYGGSNVNEQNMDYRYRPDPVSFSLISERQLKTHKPTGEER